MLNSEMPKPKIPFPGGGGGGGGGTHGKLDAESRNAKIQNYHFWRG